MNKLLEVRDWQVAFREKNGWINCIEDINFSLNAGEVLGVAGASGTGKSVLFQSLMGLYDHQEINCSANACASFMETEPIFASNYKKYRKKIRPFLKKHIGMVFQDPKGLFNPKKSLRQHFQDACKLVNTPCNDEIIREKLLVTGCPVEGEKLSKWFEHPLHKFSGGEAQRIQIALSLLNPELKLLICDEITSNLDAHSQWNIVNLLAQLKEQNKLAIIFISHDWEKLTRLCDELLILDKKEEEAGRINQQLKKSYFSKQESLAADPVISELLPLNGLPVNFKDQSHEPPLIEVENLSKQFSRNPILHNINLKVYQGETYALIGESGSGKSTLGKLILGVEKMQETTGQLRVFGEDRRERKGYDTRLQMVFQNFSQCLNPYMKIEQHLKALTKNKANQVSADHWLAHFHLKDHLAKLPSQLSGGQKRRFGLVEAFTMNPEVIIADEPTAGLDKARQARFLQEIKKQQQRERSIFLISHDLKLVGHFADRIGVLYSGHLIQELTVNQLTPNFEHLHPYTELLLKAKEMDLSVPEKSKGRGCPYFHRCHRREQVNCEYENEKPKLIKYELGWSTCPYPV